MLNKRLILLLGGLAALLLTITAVYADGGVVERVRGRTFMVVPLSEFNPDLEGEAIMHDLDYEAYKLADGTVGGHYSYTLEVFGRVDEISGSVICLKTDGNRAWIGTNVEETNNPDREGVYGWWQVEDNGFANDRTTFLGFGSLEATIEYCEGPDPNFIFSVDRGDVKVDD